jgi:ComF family protein
MAVGMVDNPRGGLLELLAPARCLFCCAPAAAHGACEACSKALPWNERACRACGLPLAGATAAGACGDCLRAAPPQDASWVAFRYAAPLDQAIVDLKFHGRLAPAHVLGGLMARRLARRPEPLPELLIPVPLSPGRLRRRGYNQALELGRELARLLSLPLAPSAARRVRATLEQTRLDAPARRRNVRGAFAVAAAAVAGRHVALLDDVVTTGATMAELARATRAAGAARIEAWAAARAL